MGCECREVCSKERHCEMCNEQLCVEFRGGCAMVPARSLDGYYCDTCWEDINSTAKDMG